MLRDAYLEDYVEEINLELEKLRWKRIAVWGLGEYAEKIFVYTKLLSLDIKYCIDGRRLGEFAGFHISRPDDVDWESVDCVVVLSFYRWEEIENALDTKYQFRGMIVKPGIGYGNKEFYKYFSKARLAIDERYTKILQPNEKFKNSYTGKKCFILGNGPSLNTLDLSKIRDGVIFATNEFYKWNSDVDVNHYVVADPFYFDEAIYNGFGKSYFINLNNYSKAHKELYFWFPLMFKTELEKRKIAWDNIHYYYINGQWENRVDCNVDLAGPIIGRTSVVQYCIMIAIYMGVKEIYLVGCEETGVYGVLNNYLDKGFVAHAYDNSEKELQVLSNYAKTVPIHSILEGFSYIFRGYLEMNELCNENGIRLYICAKETLVEGIEYIDFYKAVQ